MFFRTLLRMVATPALWILPLDSLLRSSQYFGSAAATLLFYRDWRLQRDSHPMFFKHQINLSRWPFEPGRWSFAARGVYARETMFKGCAVLDLCCGDGSYSRLFFSDIAGRIDAVDHDQNALTYARRHNAGPAIAYHDIDIVNQPLPPVKYDVVVWNAAICYFETAEIRSILQKIVQAGAPAMTLTGMLPRASGYVDHKTEFADTEAVKRLLAEYWQQVTVKEVDEVSAVNFYFQAAQPIARAVAGTNST